MSAQRPAILVVDDDESLRKVMATELRRMGMTVDGAATLADARSALERTYYPVILLDLHLGGTLTTASYVSEIQLLSPDTCIIILTGHATVETAVQLLKAGVYDYKTKPCPLDELESAIRRAIEHARLRRDNRALREAMTRGSAHAALVGQSRAMLMLRTQIEQAAAQDVPVLITGESGTGKEVAARLIHDMSPRSKSPFVVVDAGAIPESLVEAELFGCKKGAFTGADRDREGLAATAAGGTLFFDEIGDLPSAIQPKLLRFLESREYRRVGDTQLRPADVRILSATNRPLRALVADGKFREDLYFRLNVFPIEIRPLRERPDDIEPLTAHLLATSAVRRAQPLVFEPSALERMRLYRWPGNVRELRNVIDRLMIVSGPAVTAKQIDDLLTAGETGVTSRGVLTLAESEAAHIRSVLALCGGDKKQAADQLGISLKTLYNKIHANNPDVSL